MVFLRILKKLLISAWIFKLIDYIKSKRSKKDPLVKLERLFVNLAATTDRLSGENFLLKAALSIGNVYIVDITTNTILFANPRLKDIFGDDIEGKTCYEVFQGDTNRCKFCTNDIIQAQEGVPHYWTFSNPLTGELYVIGDVYMRVPTLDQTAHVRYEMAMPMDKQMVIDIADYGKRNYGYSSRD